MARRPAAALLAALLLLPAAARAGDEPAGGKKGAKPPASATAGGGEKAKPAGGDAPLVRQRTPRDRKDALRLLEAVRINVSFEATPVREVVSYLSAVSGVNVVLGPALLAEADVEALRVDLRLRKVTPRQVLELVAKSHSLGIGFRNGLLLLTTEKEARGKPVLRLYTVADLTMPIRDFPGPDLMLRPAGAEFEPERESESKQAFSDADDILALIRDNTGSGTWEDEGVSSSVMNDWLVIRQYPDVHEEIARLLSQLRAHR